MTRSNRKENFLETLYDAQTVAFSPFIFKATSAALKTGLLERAAKRPGETAEELASALGLTEYAISIVTDILVAGGILEKRDERFTTTPVGDCLVFDDMTRANFFFTDDVNYAGLEKTLDALLEGRPAGLSVFDPSWKTIYPHIPELPEEAKASWFRFDHFHSDQAYRQALDVLSALDPEHLVDIGGNTGRFTKCFLERFPHAEATLVDLPIETETLLNRPELQDVADRIRTRPIDWLTDQPLDGTDEGDLYWMSQFLDCFSFEEVKSILTRTKAAMKPGAKLAVLEPVCGEQRHSATELSLAATNLYFTVLANGNSRFFEGNTLRKLFAESGFRVESEYPNLGISHTLFILTPMT